MSWLDAREYCRWAGGRLGIIVVITLAYLLVTELVKHMFWRRYE
jgi:hypothetical protein